MKNDTTEWLFETARLAVRHFRADDLDAFAALCADPQVLGSMGDGNTLPRSEVARWIDVCQKKYATCGYGTSAVFERTGGQFVGFCGVIRAPNNDFDELIYAYHAETWGKGYATEAGRAMLAYVFGISTLDRIWATIDEQHTASIHVAQKLGMHFDHEEIDDGGVVRFYATERTA